MDSGIFDPTLLNVNGYIRCFMCGRIAWTMAQDFSEPINITWLGAINQGANGVVEFSAHIFGP